MEQKTQTLFLQMGRLHTEPAYCNAIVMSYQSKTKKKKFKIRLEV